MDAYVKAAEMHQKMNAYPYIKILLLFDLMLYNPVNNFFILVGLYLGLNQYKVECKESYRRTQHGAFGEAGTTD